MVRVVFLIVALVTVSVLSQGSDDSLRQQIDEFVNAILQCNSIPGANIAVVRNGQVFHTNGYGVKDLGTQEPMTDSTLMNIASLSKHFVATTMAKTLETNPSYDWSDSVRSILGDTFYLSNGYLSNKVTITDLLCHRVGIARHDLTRVSGWSMDDLISHLPYLESSREFRDRHQYNNLMYIVADKVIQVISGRASWEDILQESFLDPLGMTDTTFVTNEQAWPDFATSYLDDGGQLREVSLQVNKADYTISTSAGGIGTNALDMAKWMLFQLSGGLAPGGAELVDPGLLDDTHDHCGVTGSSTMYKYPSDPVNYDRNSKAKGLFEGFYREYYITGHSGSKGGFQSLLTMFPDVDLGVYTTVTGPTSDERDLIHLFVADLLLNKTAWLDSETICDIVDPARTYARDRSDHRTHFNMNSLMPYRGTFGHFGYGNITINLNNTSGGLDMEYGPGPSVRWSLEQQSETHFVATGYDEYWHMSYDLDFEDVGDGNYDRVEIDFDSRAPATFERGLDIGDVPPPPPLCA